MIIESIEDFRKKYRNTYVFLEIDGKKHLVRYESDNEQEFEFDSPTFGSILVNEKTAREKISFFFPKAGLYNINNTLVDFTRYPARQWRRAPCQDNVHFQAVNTRIKRSFNDARIHFNFNTASNLFFPSYSKTTEAAIKQVTANGVAINNLFGVTIPPKKYNGSFILWYRQSPVGFIDPDKKEVTVKYAPLYQEVCDHYTKKEPEWKIHLKT